MILLFLGLLAIAAILWGRAIVRKKHIYYPVKIFVTGEESDEQPEEESPCGKNLRRSLHTGELEVCRMQWVYIVPWLSFLFSKKRRMPTWQPLLKSLVAKAEQGVAEYKKDCQKVPELYFWYRSDLPEPEPSKREKKKLKLSKKKSYYPWG